MAFDAQELQAYYAAQPLTSWFDATCHMSVPHDVWGKTVVDVACRRGKGVYKFSGMVGDEGLAIGVEWREGMIERANAGVEHAMAKSGLTVNNMRFIEVYPEQLAQVIDAQSVDVLYVNSIMNLFCSPQETFKAIHDIMKPDGLFVLETVIASAPRDAGVVEAARKLGNAIQAGVDADTLFAWLGDAGFRLGTMRGRTGGIINPAWDAEGNPVASCAPSTESVEFTTMELQVRA